MLAQFSDVAAQTCTWTWAFTVDDATDVVGMTLASTGVHAVASLSLFLVSRFVMTWLLGIFRPTRLLLIMAAVGVVLSLVAVVSARYAGLVAVVCISVSLPLMIPTPYGVALHGLGEDAKFGAAGLVVAILGGATVPLVQARVMDVAPTTIGHLVPAVCLALVGASALFDLCSSRPAPSSAVAG